MIFNMSTAVAKRVVVSHKDKYKNKLNQEAVEARGADLLQCARETANKLNGIYIFMTHSIYGRN